MARTTALVYLTIKSPDLKPSGEATLSFKKTKHQMHAFVHVPMNCIDRTIAGEKSCLKLTPTFQQYMYNLFVIFMINKRTCILMTYMYIVNNVTY